jgi:chromosome segregation ATPase
MANDMTTEEVIALGKALGRQFAGVAKLGEICDKIGALAGGEAELQRNVDALKVEIEGHLKEIESLKEQKAAAQQEVKEALAAREGARHAVSDAAVRQKEAEAKIAAINEEHAKTVATAQIQKDGMHNQITEMHTRIQKIEADHKARVDALKTEQANIAEKIASLKDYHDSFKSRIAPLLTA